MSELRIETRLGKTICCWFARIGSQHAHPDAVPSVPDTTQGAINFLTLLAKINPTIPPGKSRVASSKLPCAVLI
jgi:hypothetical protein